MLEVDCGERSFVVRNMQGLRETQNRETDMQLHENLQICLLALMHRQPDHVLDINETIVGPQRYGAEGWRASDVIEMLVQTSPELLRASACLSMDGQETVVYLTARSEKIPAFWIYCQGKIPPCQGNMRAREQALLSFVG